MRKKNKKFLKFIKLLFDISILFLFIGGYFKLFSTLNTNTSMKIIFSLIYLWFTIGMNVNLILPLSKLIDNKINKL